MQDLIHFDHRAFWKKNLLLREIDFQLYGKCCHFESIGKKADRVKPIIRTFADGRIRMNVWRRKGYALAYTRIYERILAKAKESMKKSKSERNKQQADTGVGKNVSGRLKRKIEPEFEITAQLFYDYCKLPLIPKYKKRSLRNKTMDKNSIQNRRKMMKLRSEIGKMGTDKVRRCLIEIDNSLFLPDSD